MEDNKLLARGITKEGTFCYGYYVYDKFKKKHHILIPCEEEDTFWFVASEDIEIIQEPDRCLGIRDCEGELYFEYDEVQTDNGIYTVKYEAPSFNLVRLGEDGLIYEYYSNLDYYEGFNPLCHTWTKFKIIHPTNKDEIESRS